MIGRRTLARCAAVLILSIGVSSCGGLRLPRIPGLGGKASSKYQGPGARIPVLSETDALKPSAALKGVDFALPPAQPQADWPLPGGTPEQSVEHAVAGQNFSIAWRRKVGQGIARGHRVTATPVIAQGRIYTLDGAGLVSAHDERSGAEIWRNDLAPRSGRDKDAYGGGVAFDDGTVYVSSGYRFVTALDAATGKVKWRTATPSPVHGAPTVSAGRVFVVDIEDQLMAFNAADGLVVWNFQALEEPARVIAASSPAVSGEVLVAPFASGEVSAFRTANGNALWSDTLTFTNRNYALSEIRDVAGRPVIYRGDVFAGSHSGMFGAISLRDGSRRWDLPISTITTPLPTGDVVYVTDQAGLLICIARESGQVYWTVDLNAGAKKKKDRAVWSGPLLASDKLIVVSTKGEAVALNPHTGARLQSLKLGSGAFLSPIAANGTVYVLSEAAELIAIR
ncbi:MAG TPA: PQQ-binding-like beta-propeller repeat protein [Caulobacteraceae bacterium]|jgi:outer membrane protein assembly factor BamB|nr:PQQ-binding-like beta-propeller repeat protein [Caulobacteraceae bacterium]